MMNKVAAVGAGLAAAFTAALAAALTACAPALHIRPLPCAEPPAEVARAANEKPPSPSKIPLPRPFRGPAKVSVYLIIDPAGKVKPDSIMICGINRPAIVDEYAKRLVDAVIKPGTRDGIPVRSVYKFDLYFGLPHP